MLFGFTSNLLFCQVIILLYHKIVFILFGTLLCIASLFIWNEFELGNIDSSNELALLRIDFVIACSFSIEWIISITSSHEGIIVAFFDFENLIDGLIIF